MFLSRSIIMFSLHNLWNTRPSPRKEWPLSLLPKNARRSVWFLCFVTPCVRVRVVVMFVLSAFSCPLLMLLRVFFFFSRWANITFCLFAIEHVEVEVDVFFFLLVHETYSCKSVCVWLPLAMQERKRERERECGRLVHVKNHLYHSHRTLRKLALLKNWSFCFQF